MLIRAERDSDIPAVRALTDVAFADVPQSRHTEVALIDGLRAAGELTVSLVAVDGDDIVGHVALSPVTIDGDAEGAWYGGGPLSVWPARQGRGIGTALVGAAVERLKGLGAAGCIVVGDPGYYGRFGFISSPEFVVPQVPAENVLALSLSARVPTGTVSFHPAFAAESPDHGN